jgi:hypothetical protein
MRWYIIRVLLVKEGLRYLANRGTLALAVLLIVLDILLSYFGRAGTPAGGLIGGVQLCYVDYWRDEPWIDYLREHVPPEMANQVKFRSMAGWRGVITYPQNTGGIQIRPEAAAYRIQFWHPGADGGALAPFEAWFWKETGQFQLGAASAALKEAGTSALIPHLTTEYRQLQGAPDIRSTIASILVLFPLLILCIYLLPSMTCEERERGVLLAQALSPASPAEILAAKFLFYQVVGMIFGAILAGLFDPRVLTRPFFWLTLGAAAFGAQAIGLTIASLARTQRAASMGALSYMMAVTALLFICQQNRIPILPYLTLEYHLPRMFQAVLGNGVQRYHWGNLAAAWLLAAAWGTLAIQIFRRKGWQ